MVLTYMEVHLYYTLPVVAGLVTVLRPFHCAQDRVKYLFLISMALATATPWDNYIVYHRAWWYCPSCVTAVIGYVPLEEYMFFAIMTMMTVSFANLVMRWQLPAFFLKSSMSSFQNHCLRFIPITGFLAVGMKAWALAVPNTPLFYGACILWYTCPVLGLLWFGAGPYICRRWKAVALSILIPTFYLCWVDKVAIHAGTWRISERTTTKIMVVPHLPLEEAMFFFLINVVLVFATCAMDRAFAVMHLLSSSSSFDGAMTWATMAQLFDAFCTPDEQLDKQPLSDLVTTWGILKTGSVSFHAASAVFPAEQRQDLGVLYGFCRATDDLADDESVPAEDRLRSLALVRSFVMDMFLSKTNCAADLDWTPYNGQLSPDCLASMRSFVRLRHSLAPDAIMELLDGYEWDLQKRPIQNNRELEYYAACVASSVGEMCTRILLKNQHGMLPATQAWIVARARDMGLVLQYTNIARDIVTDSKTLGRCYLPLTWLSANEQADIFSGDARKLGDARLRSLALKLVGMADELVPGALRAVDKLPAVCQGGVRAACGVYCAIGEMIKLANGYPTRAYVKKAYRAWLVLACVYKLPTSWSVPANVGVSFPFKSALSTSFSLVSTFSPRQVLGATWAPRPIRKGKVRAFYVD
ncbi:Lycopene beta-cyclase [Gongronella butleri]|nr:Lycopene beta-cyclase [Gongronella butleri]